MNRDIPLQVAYDRTNKGVDTREASTANFLIDSEDRAGFNATTVISGASFTSGTSADFTITKLGQNLITGFFTRIAMTEIQIKWNIENVRDSTPDLSGNNETGVSIRNTGTGAIINYPVAIFPGYYTVQEALDALIVNLNTSTPNTFTLVDSAGTSFGVYGKKAIQISGAFQFAFYRQTATPATGPIIQNLSQSLGFPVFPLSDLPLAAGLFKTAWTAYKPNLLLYNYIDITSSQLASQQKVKDATTSNFDAIDVIYRWVFTDGTSTNVSGTNNIVTTVSYDAYGYPILQGYRPFTSTRYLSFPKQVRWDPLIPVGNLNLQTYTDKETLLRYSGFREAFEFKMLMLISEV
jgi:hypothetical protein